MSPQTLSNFQMSNASNDTAVADHRAQEEDAPEDGQEVKGESDDPVPDAHEESRKPRAVRRPVLPTEAEINKHFPLQLKYRSWLRSWPARLG